MPDHILATIYSGKDNSAPRFALPPADDLAQIQMIIAAYGRFYDDEQMEDFVSLLAEDAIFYPNWPGVAPEQVSGKEKLGAFFTAARQDCHKTGILPRHYATNVLVRSTGQDSAEATVSMLYAESRSGETPAVKMIGQYDYQFQRIEQSWCISRWSMRYDK